MGASCAGSTTLGTALAKQLSYPYFDTDSYFWEPSEIPFTIKRNPVVRNNILKDHVAQHNNWILGGSMVSWGDEWPALFDLVVFLYIPHDIKMQRLMNREHERYGEIISTDINRQTLHQEFVQWAKGYDDNTTKGRTLQVHQDWLKKLPCPVIEITGDTTVSQRISIILSNINNNNVL